MATYQDITNSVSRFFVVVDNKDWDGAMELMTSPMHLDYSSFGAGPAKDVEPNEVIDGSKGMLLGLDHTQHNLGPLDIMILQDHDSAGKKCLVKACVVGVHYLANDKQEGTEEISPLWNVYGSYSMELTSSSDNDGWKLSSLTLLYKFQTGNLSIPKLAQEKAKVLQKDS